MNNCDKCLLNGQRRLQNQVWKEADVLVIVDLTQKIDIAKNKPLAGQHGEVLAEVFSKLGIGNYQIATTTQCLIPEKTSVTRSELEYCSEYLATIIEQVKPKQILALGSASAIALFHGPVDKGKFYTYNGISVIHTFGIDYVLKNRKLFTKWTEHISKLVDNTPKWKDYTYEEVDTDEGITKLFTEFLDKEFLAMDYETTSLNPFGSSSMKKARPLCMTFSYDGDHAFYVPCDKLTDSHIALLDEVCQRVVIIGSNFANYDWHISYENYGISASKVFDTVIASYLLDETSGEHGLKKLAQLYLEAPDWDLATKKYIKDMENCPHDLMVPYACVDAIASYRLGMLFREELKKEGLLNLYEELMYPSIASLANMSHRGITIDLTKQNELAIFLDTELKDLLSKAQLISNSATNLNSPSQLAAYWFGKKGYTPLKMGKTGPSTDAQTRKYLYLRYGDELVPFVDEYAKYQKLKGTYVDGLRSRLDSQDKLHTTFKLQVTATGRLSSRDPNLQNIPKRKGKEIRKLFIPNEGCVLADFDYSNLEVRVGALESQDEVLATMINSGVDVHRKVASMIYGIAEEHVTDIQRTYAKTGTFGVMYGMTYEGASFKLGLSKADAFELVKNVKAIFKGLNTWAEAMCKMALEKQYVTTRFGRYRRFPLIINEKDENSIKRQAVNTPIQSLASDICLSALNNMGKVTDVFTPQIIVHDSLVGSLNDVSDDSVNRVKAIMTTIPFETNVRFDVDCKIGPNWGDVEDYVYANS